MTNYEQAKERVNDYVNHILNGGLFDGPPRTNDLHLLLKRLEEFEKMLPDAGYVTCMWCNHKVPKECTEELAEHILTCEKSPTHKLAGALKEREHERDKLREQVRVLEGRLLREIVRGMETPRIQCNCDLDNWEPEQNTGHSWVCDIHKQALARADAVGKEKGEQ